LITTARGQAQSSPADSPPDDPPATLFPHSQTARYWVSGQDNIIVQWHPSFDANDSGPNSFRARAEHATSNVATLFLGLAATATTELFLDVETADGGVSDALGIAGFINVDVVRNPQLGPAPYLARAMVHQIIPLSAETVEAERGPSPWQQVFPRVAWNCARANSVWPTSSIRMVSAATAIISS